MDNFYSDILEFFDNKGITPISLLNSIKAVDYYRQPNLYILVPKSSEVINVWNGYIYHYEFAIIVGSPNLYTFEDMKSNVHKLIGNNLYNEQVYVVYVTKQELDTSVRNFYREIFDITINLVIS